MFRLLPPSVLAAICISRYPHHMELRVALYQPDIPGNTGTILRMAACLGFAVDLIEPAGFDISDRSLKRAGMDYLEQATLTRHADWHHFEDWRLQAKRRIVLLSTKAAIPYTDYRFQENDILLFGRESSGVPDNVHNSADARLLIPMMPGARSLNLAVSVAMTAGEALRQRRDKVDSLRQE
ncbi:tRNA (cytidine(34)-2'-O)-methyltransferase [Brucella sp. NBRC 13694]|uniref:tRNA (cytidine(34)-2'-O)-methyltransferase n=4 Tax=Brucella TaxID=234 RepID=A6WZD2_BRUA4|nr:tRNA/rRNA methyltransferase (SpoU) [Brucella anthropi ATCC 49188]SUA65181.1 tRNA (cytidine(34)-2'-O)-methyltransferase [Brucella anthropi]